MQSSLYLMRMQVETLFCLDPHDRMTGLNEQRELPAPRLFLGRTADGNVWRYRHDLPATVIRDLNEILIKEPVGTDLQQTPMTFDQLSRVLTRHAPIVQVWLGPAWYVPAEVHPISSIEVV